MHQSVRVLHIIDTLWLGGAQTIQKEYFENQPENSDIFLYALRRSDPQLKIKHPNISVYNSFSRFSFYPLIALKKHIEQNKIDILHCHLLRSHFTGYLLKLFFFRNIRLVIHEHGDILENSGLSSFILKIIKRKADVFITCSEALKKTLVEKIEVDAAAVKTVYNFVNAQKNKTPILQVIPEASQPERFYIGFAGRLIRRKGWEQLIEAAKILIPETNVYFEIAGEGPDKAKILDKIKAHQLKNVTLRGYTKNMDLFYNKLNCLIVPSHYEPMGMVAIEAQAFGVPVIASNVSGMNELLLDEWNALLFTPGNATELVTCIKKMKDNNNLRNKLIINGFENSKVYSFENYKNNIDNIYLNIF